MVGGAEVLVDLDAGQMTIMGADNREGVAKAIERAGYTVAG